MTVILPIYYTQEFKTKPNKTSLVGMNLYRNAHHFLQNNMKKHFQDLVIEQLPSVVEVIQQFTVTYKLYYKSPVCDASNVIALIEKFYLDSLKANGTIIDDNVQYHISSSWQVVAQDKTNPRIEVTIKELT